MIEIPNKDGLGATTHKLDPVLYPEGHTSEQQLASRLARQDRRAKAEAKRLMRQGRPSRLRQTVAGVAVAAVASAGAIVASHRDNEYLRKNTPVAPVTTVAPGIPTQEHLEDKATADIADRAQEQSELTAEDQPDMLPTNAE